MSTATPIDYGHDLACVDDLDPLMTEVSGERVVQEVIARRCRTAPGMNVDAPNEGIDLRDYIGDDTNEEGILRLRADVLHQATDDPRVFSATADMTIEDVGAEAKVTIALDADGAEGPFALVLSVDSLTVAILRGDV